MRRKKKWMNGQRRQRATERRLKKNVDPVKGTVVMDVGSLCLTQKAQESLEKCEHRIARMIYNIAEKGVLSEGRDEINETDILNAQKRIIVAMSSAKRKWGIRMLIFLTFSFLVGQVGAFYQLFLNSNMQALPFIIQIWLVLPPFLVLAFMTIFSWFFREDWT